MKIAIVLNRFYPEVGGAETNLYFQAQELSKRHEVTVFTPEAKVSYGQRLGLAVRNGLKSTAEFFSDFLLWFVEALPALVILAVLIVVVVILIRRAAKKRRARKAAEKEAK